jgi:hypothetical protein
MGVIKLGGNTTGFFVLGVFYHYAKPPFCLAVFGLDGEKAGRRAI